MVDSQFAAFGIHTFGACARQCRVVLPSSLKPTSEATLEDCPALATLTMQSGRQVRTHFLPGSRTEV
jgi:hypothetical protein